ncbi:MAG: hypothetical protein AAFR05_18820, partial [Bacteroidota bacterium]
WAGILGLILFAAPLVYASLRFLLKEVEQSVSYKKGFAYFGTLLFAFAIFLLKAEADERRQLLDDANDIKSYLVANRWKLMGVDRIKEKLGAQIDTHRILKTIEAFPEEFSWTELSPPGTVGIELVAAPIIERIDQETERLLPYAKAKVQHHLESKQGRAMTFKTLRDSVDARFDEELLTWMVARYDSVFVPINIIVEGSNQSGLQLKKGDAGL